MQVERSGVDGWTLRVRARGGLMTDDVSANRLSVWADGGGRVVRAEFE